MMENLRAQLERTQKEVETKWSEKMASEQQLTTLNDEVEGIKAEKKKLRSNLETKEKELEGKDKEIEDMERETKSLIKIQVANQEKISSQVNQITRLQKQVRDGEHTIKEKGVLIANLQSTLEAQKKEEQAIEALKNELDTKRSETEELRSTVTQMQSQVDAKDYDIKRLKEDRDQLMSHYQQQLKKASEELAIERREQS